MTDIQIPSEVNYKFICFLKINCNKFKFVINNEEDQDLTFKQVFEHIRSISTIALNTFDYSNYIFELNNPNTKQTEILLRSEQFIPNNSIIIIDSMPSPMFRGTFITSGFEFEALKHRTKDMINFYHIVNTIRSHFKSIPIHLLKSEDIVNKASKLFPYLITWKHQELYSKMNNKIEFYIDHFVKLNWKIPLPLQRRFDLIKIIHTIPKFQLQNRRHREELIKIEQELDIMQYRYYQNKYQYDIYLKSFSVVTHSKTTEEFIKTYLEEELSVHL